MKPYKGANGVRRYTKEDIETLRTVYHLVKERKLTLAGAKQQFKYGGPKETAETNINNTSNKQIIFFIIVYPI